MSRPFYLPQTEDPFLHLAKPLIFFDLETTGTNPLQDRIVELYAIKLSGDGRQQEIHFLLNPTIPIPAGATEVHGITNEMVAGKPLFADMANELSAFFSGCDLAGYNIKRFDVPLLLQEFHRCKKYPINYNETKLVDVMGIYHSKEKRDLSAAVKFYCQREHTDAHSAKADVQATIAILKKQLLQYDDLEPNTSFLHDYLNAGGSIDFSGKFLRDEAGRIVFNFGQHKGKEACTERDYLLWMYKKGDFTVDTKMVAKRIYMHCQWEDKINAWLQSQKLTKAKEVTAALYATVKYGEGIWPFAVQKQNEGLVVTHQTQQPSSFTLAHPDAVRLLLKLLDQHLREPVMQ